MKKLIALLMTLCMLIPAAALGDATLTMSASAEVHVAADCVQLVLGVNRTCPTVSTAAEEVAGVVANLNTALQAAGILSEDITTADYYTCSVYDWNQDPAVITGYTVSHTINVLVRQVADAGRIIDTAVSAGAGEINGLSFRCSDTTEAYDQALTAAIAEAGRKAKVAAAACGMEIAEVTSVMENTVYAGPVFEVRSMAAADKEEAAGTEVSSGTLSVSAQVTVTYTMR